MLLPRAQRAGIGRIPNADNLYNLRYLETSPELPQRLQKQRLRTVGTKQTNILNLKFAFNYWSDLDYLDILTILI